MLFFLKAYFRRLREKFRETEVDNVTKLDQKLVFARRQKKFPNFAQTKYVRIFLHPKEIAILLSGISLIVVGILTFSYQFSSTHIVSAPAVGGTYREGVLGSIARVSPFFAPLNPIDEDISQLIFSPLLRYNRSNGEVKLDLAKNITEDKNIVTVTLQEAYFHDNTKVTAQDVVFTYQTILDKATNSPLKDQIITLQKVEAKNDNTVEFTFIREIAHPEDLLTIGIVPEHAFAGIPHDQLIHAPANTTPIGSGPYQFGEYNKEKSLVTLHRYQKYHGNKPFIETVEFRMATLNEELEEWYAKKEVDAVAGLSNETMKRIPKSGAITHKLELPEYTAIFYNQNKSSRLSNETIREALSLSIDPESLVHEGLLGNGTAINTPLIMGMPGYESLPFETNISEADEQLTTAGWSKVSLEEVLQKEKEKRIADFKKRYETETKSKPTDEVVLQEAEKISQEVQKEFDLTVPYARIKNNEILKITLTTANHEDTQKIAELIKASWGKIGVMTKINLISTEELSTQVLPQHDFEALLLGVLVNNHADPYAVWYNATKSSSPAIARFNDSYVDELINKARSAKTEADAESKNRAFAKYVVSKKLATILYRPTFYYIISDRVSGVTDATITSPSARFENITSWYVRTRLTWKW